MTQQQALDEAFFEAQEKLFAAESIVESDRILKEYTNQVDTIEGQVDNEPMTAIDRVILVLIALTALGVAIAFVTAIVKFFQ